MTFYILCVKSYIKRKFHYTEYKMKRLKRPLGSQGSLLLTTLAGEGKDIFTLEDAQKVLKTDKGAVMTLLSRLEDKNWVVRLTPGKYLIVPLSAGEEAEFTEDWFIIGRHLIEPAPYYFSYYSALSLHEMTTQPIMTIYVTTPKRRREVKVLGATYRFVYTKPEKIWGIEEIWAKPTEKVKVSDLERTIIDCLSNPKLCGGISEVAKGIWIKRGEIDFEKLSSYVMRFGSKAVAKRLGFLLELFEIGPQKIRKELKQMVTSTFVLFDPSLPNKGRYQSKWRLRMNLNPQELKEIIKT